MYFVLVAILFLLFFAVGLNYQKYFVKNFNSSAISKKTDGNFKSEEQRLIEYFTSSVLPDHQQVASQISESAIIKVEPISVLDTTQGWVVVTRSQKKNDVYLLLGDVQKKLESPMTSNNGYEVTCDLTQIELVGNTQYEKLADSHGYLVLSGRDCQDYGGGSFTSVYRLSDGSKVVLAGNVSLSNPRINGVSPAGNAQGRLVGVYGHSEPTVVVEFGLLENASEAAEEVSKMAFFDLQTGQLKQIIEFR